jgi:hypothetical protein
MSKLNEQYSQFSIDITRELSKDEKKEYGIFITPQIILKKLVDSIIKYAPLWQFLFQRCSHGQSLRYIPFAKNELQRISFQFDFDNRHLNRYQQQSILFLYFPKAQDLPIEGNQ